MAVIPIIQQTWDTTSYVNPTRMNNIETNIGILSKATGIEYSSGVSVKDKIDEVDGKTADDIPYSTGVSVKDKIDTDSTPVDISSQITFNETYIDTSSSNTTVKVVKMGKMVVVTISGLALKQALSGSTTFISNLPIPIFDINIGLTNPISGQTSNDGWNTSRCRLRDTGELKIWFDNIPQTSVPFGQFTYFTN